MDMHLQAIIDTAGGGRLRYHASAGSLVHHGVDGLSRHFRVSAFELRSLMQQLVATQPVSSLRSADWFTHAIAVRLLLEHLDGDDDVVLERVPPGDPEAQGSSLPAQEPDAEARATIRRRHVARVRHPLEEVQGA